MAPRAAVECGPLKMGCGQGPLAGRGQGRRIYTPRSVFFPLGSVLGVISLPEVGGHSQKGQLGRGLWGAPATSCSSRTFCLPSSRV